MGPFPRLVTNLTIFKFRGLTELESCCTFIRQSRERSTRELLIAAFQLIASAPVHPPTCTFLRRGGGSSVVDTIKGYPTKRVLLGRDSVVMVRGMIWETFSPYSICFLFFLSSWAHAYGKHAPAIQVGGGPALYTSVWATISGRKSGWAGRRNTSSHARVARRERERPTSRGQLRSFGIYRLSFL